MFAGDQLANGLTLHTAAKVHLVKCGSGQMVAGRFEQCRLPRRNGRLAFYFRFFHKTQTRLAPRTGPWCPGQHMNLSFKCVFL